MATTEINCGHGNKNERTQLSSDLYDAQQLLLTARNIQYVPCHKCTARSQVPDLGNGLQIWRVAANTLNKQSEGADKGWFSTLCVGWRANNLSHSIDLSKCYTERWIRAFVLA
jgi:hypothetical protein